MKARNVKYLENGGLEIVEYDVPDPGPGEVQVKKSACGICAWDLNTYRNGTAAGHAAPPGHEGIGYVTKVGAGVTSVKEGDRVTGGGFATVENVKQGQAYLVPEIGLDDAYWVVEPLSCVVTGVDHCAMKIGDRIALVGCGFMGLLMAQCLKESFAERVTAFDIVPERLALAKAFGMDEVLNPMDEGFEADLARVAATNIDCVVDTSGSRSGFALSNRLVKRGGRLNIFGWIHGPVEFSGDDWHGNGYTVVMSSPSAKIRDVFPVAIRLIELGIIDPKPVVSHIVPLDEMDALLKGVIDGTTTDYIKGIITLD